MRSQEMTMRNSLFKRTSAVLISLVCLGTQGSAAGQHDALVEKSKMSFLNAFSSLEKVLYTCASMPVECGLSDKDSSLSYAVYKEIMFKMNRASAKNLIFKSGAAEPGLFDIDGAPRIAVTEYRVGAPIYVNTDFLFVEDEAHNFHSISFEQASAILFHELGHHLSPAIYGTLTHERLDAVGASIALYLQQHRTSESVLVTDANSKSVAVKVSHIELMGRANQGQDKTIILVESPTDEKLVYPEYKKFAKCPRAYYRGILAFEGYPFDFSFRNIALSIATNAASVATAEIAFAGANAYCINKVAGHENEYQTFDRYKAGSMTFKVEIAQDGMITVDQSSFVMNVKTPDDVQYY
jgi:hypothetical protein